ncbi:membrane protein [Longibacter salinarum]|uniref:Membrane protein n=1 Tax=Longibacter salinarum TaxID=1850348 RepID=A0A2A8D092_9BACT|nr:DUF2723 domain-containing protein [Longibacter salinarum]PEN14372.1 membrane protein [Longibacter salinarum]
MNWKWTDRIAAGFVFVWALVLYSLTVAPTTSFWDAGEFIASVYKLQVMHPPGAPFYMLMGRFFSMFVPTDYVALAVNMISVLSSAGTVLLTHLIILRLVRRWHGAPSTWSPEQRVVGLGSGIIGALAFAASDTFWFNAVEAEVYALSMFFTALVVYLAMRWSDEAAAEERLLAGGRHPFGLSANRYLVLIAYFFGLAIGVHLLNLLAFFFVALIIFFTEYDQPEWDSGKRLKMILVTGVVASIVFFTIYPGVILYVPKFIGAVGSPLIAVFLLVALVLGGLYVTHKRQMQVANIALLCLTVILVGYSSYALIFIRSATEPNIDLNDPDTPERFVSYLEREQYGSTPLLKGMTYDDESGVVPREGEASPEWFPRRHSISQSHWRVYDRYDSDWEFFWEYQVGHMYVRYFLWNFAGRQSDVQDAPAVTGISFVDPPDTQLRQTPSEKASHNVYFALPLLLGLFGAFYHASRDWRRAFSVFTLFLVTGIGIIIYLNQSPNQPRERDYAYVASFFAFSLWIGIGAGGMLELAYDAIRSSLKSMQRTSVMTGVAALIFAAVPLWMTAENYDDHDRSGNFVARDYAYNMLNSVAENGVLFTNGDNDTYPLWYMQEVEGIRTDVRVANLSLLNTDWYVKQMKNEQAYKSEPLPISMSEQQINNLRPTRFEPRRVQIPVQADAADQFSDVYLAERTTDSLSIQRPMSWRLEGRAYGRDVRVLQVADLVAYNMIRTAAEDGWNRPIYFATTVARDGTLNLDPFFQLEGQANRVVPIRSDAAIGRAVPGLTEERMNAFRFTNLSDPDLYLNENARRMIDGYRISFSQAGEQLARQGYPDRARNLLGTFLDQVPFSTVAGDIQTFVLMARALEVAGDMDRTIRVMQESEPVVLHEVRQGSRRSMTYALQYAGSIRGAYRDAGMEEALASFDSELEQALSDANVALSDRQRQMLGLAGSGDTNGMPPEMLQPEGAQPNVAPPTENQNGGGGRP